MGSPLAPVLSNIFMSHQEKKWLEDCPVDIKPLKYLRYVDDTFLIFNDRQNPNDFLNYLNHKHPNIKLTIENETNNTLPFLDVFIQRKEFTFETSVYRKPTFTGLGTNFLSNTQHNFKISSIKTLIYRAYNLCSNYKLFNKEIVFIVNFFKNNKYPTSLVYYHIRCFLNKLYDKGNQPTIHTVNKNKIFCKIPYAGYLTYKIKNDLNLFFRKHYPQLNINLISTNNYSIGSLFKHKMPLPDFLCSSVVYSYSSLECATPQYIGSTIRQLQCRIDEHKGISVRTKLPVSTPNFSSIREYCNNKNMIINNNQFKILSRCSNPFDIRLLEALYIKKLSPPLNLSSPVELNII